MPAENISKMSSPKSLTPSFSGARIPKEKKTGISVVLRVRPLSDNSLESRTHSAIQFSGGGEVKIQTQTGSQRAFKFDVAFEPDASQPEVFEQSGVMNMLEMALEGYSCTVFAYGQTGSGKTHTVTGPPEEFLIKSEPNPENFGILPRAFLHLFEIVQARKDTVFRIRVSYFEIYNEQLVDLLNPRPVYPLNVRWRQGRGFFVENLFVIECESADDLMGVLETGMRNRAFNPTHPNEFSSRSHSIFNIMIDSEQVDMEDSSITYSTHGKLAFVDLAGSEKARDGESLSAEQMLETQTINRSLLVLGNCINALAEPKKKGSHIPIRDSKLTKLLSDSLGGDGVTLMIACVSPSSKSVTETMSTLRYAARARQIVNVPEIHADPREQLIRNLKAEIRLLRKENNFLRNQSNIAFSISPTQITTRITKRQSVNAPFNKIESTRKASETQASPTMQSTSTSPTPVKSGKMRIEPDEGGSKEKIVSHYSQSNSTATSNSGSEMGIPSYGSNNASEADYGLYEMLQEYMVENEGLRTENSNLNRHKTSIEKQYRDLMKENESLSQRIEHLEKVFQQLQPRKQTENPSQRPNEDEGSSQSNDNNGSGNVVPPPQAPPAAVAPHPLHSYLFMREPNYFSFAYGGPEQGFIIPYSQYLANPMIASVPAHEYSLPRHHLLNASVGDKHVTYSSVTQSNSLTSPEGISDSLHPTLNSLEFPQEYHPVRLTYQNNYAAAGDSTPNSSSFSHQIQQATLYRRMKRYPLSPSTVPHNRVRTYERNFENIRQYHQIAERGAPSPNSKKTPSLKPLPAIGANFKDETPGYENMNEKLRRELEELDGIINRQRKMNLLNHEITQRTQKL